MSDIALFPLARRGALVKRTAKRLLERTTREGRAAAWRQAVDKLEADLRRLGLPDPMIEKELREFHRAVSATDLPPNGAARRR
ncbi:DUF6074 family protein [Paradevosia shaoguanensis]|uniref:DUF6074 family protein n=1 Tax=Paradevosia shaoguanensis TaxID=1335043 RepID=UPI003C77A8C8